MLPLCYRLLAPLLAGAALASSPATAQWYDRSYGPGAYNRPPPAYPFDGPGLEARPLRPSDIVERLEDRGFDDVERPRLAGSVYLVTATAPNGRRVRLSVDAFRGVILDRPAALAPGLGDDPGDEDRPRLGYGRGAPSPYDEMPNAPRYRDTPEPPREPRQAARPFEPDPDTVRPRPADPRVAPEPGVVGRPLEGRSSPPRGAARPEPSARPGSAAPEGLNPDSAPARRRPASQASAPRETPPVATPPAVSPPAPRPAPTAAPAQDRDGPRRNVRVIGGVTPMNAGAGTGQLEALPAPPAVAPPTGE